MSLGRTAWSLRRRVVGAHRVVTQEHIDALTSSGYLDLRARTHIRGLHLRELALGPRRRGVVPVGRLCIELGGRDDFPVDWKAFVEIFGRQVYGASFDGARVLDVGAHKGYFGTFALARGASVVLSFEPATSNYRALERAARRDPRWLTRNAALWSTSGAGVLRLDHTSWAHSLMQVERPAGEEQVAVVTLAQALTELPRNGSPTIVKIDAEGSECDILADANPLVEVDVLLVEHHPAVAPCSADELTATVEASGLELQPSQGVLTYARSRVDVRLTTDSTGRGVPADG